MFSAVFVIFSIALLFGLGLGFAAIRLKAEDNPVVEQVNAILPQTQCAQCGYPGCRPYAEAIINNQAEINQCPPGGETTILQLAELLDRPAKPLDANYGEEKPSIVAFIREAECIGCTLCIQACPVDAIVGAAQYMHTVLAEECTGCELCVEPCPVDCIDMLLAEQPMSTQYVFHVSHT
ncbi:MAG: electron transport complex subunit RsxB [Pseudomonadota bacterium]